MIIEQLKIWQRIPLKYQMYQRVLCTLRGSVTKTQVTPKWHPSDTQVTPKWHPVDTQETPKWHPGDAQVMPKFRKGKKIALAR